MPRPEFQGGMWGWDGENWQRLVTDSDGVLIPTNVEAGVKVMKTSDTNMRGIMNDILNELKIMNLHLQTMTDEEFKDVN